MMKCVQYAYVRKNAYLSTYLKFKSTLHQNRLEEARECSIRDRGVITASLANLATSSKRERAVSE